MYEGNTEITSLTTEDIDVELMVATQVLGSKYIHQPWMGLRNVSGYG